MRTALRCFMCRALLLLPFDDKCVQGEVCCREFKEFREFKEYSLNSLISLNSLLIIRNQQQKRVSRLDTLMPIAKSQ